MSLEQGAALGAPGREPVDLVTWVYLKVKQMILDGELVPGEKVKQDHISAQLGVSPTPLVKALQRLASENLVVYQPRRGFIVRRFDAEQMAHLHRLREACEGIAAYDACSLATEADLAELRRLFEPFMKVNDWKPDSIKRYQQEDRRFHQRLLQLSGNPFLVQTLELHNFLNLSYQVGLLRPPSATIIDHLEIIEALEARDPERARAAMEKHLRLGRENIVNVFQQWVPGPNQHRSEG